MSKSSGVKTALPAGSQKHFFCHESAYVDSGACIGRNVQIWHFCHVMKGASIGDDSKLGQNVFVDRDVAVGKRAKIQNNVSVYRGVTLGDDAFVGPSVVFTNVINPRSAFPRKPEDYHITHIGNGVTLGANSTVVCGITIGDHAFIGAGSVVTKDVPAFGLVYGNPARRRAWMCVCGHKLLSPALNGSVGCSHCNRSYQIQKNLCRLT